MAGYDPQARRSRPTPPVDSPVDGLLDVLPDGAQTSPSVDRTDEAPVVDLLAESNSGVVEERMTGETVDRGTDEGLLPFETPPVEMTDERADLLHRVWVLAAVAALVLVLVAVRRRRNA
jgi:hypothetical protein